MYQRSLTSRFGLVANVVFAPAGASALASGADGKLHGRRAGASPGADKDVESHIIDDTIHYVMVDKIQLLQRFEEVLNTLLKKQKLDVYVTGSNSRFLSKDVITTFRGRGDEIKVFPFSFAEYMSAKKITSDYDEKAVNDYMQDAFLIE